MVAGGYGTSALGACGKAGAALGAAADGARDVLVGFANDAKIRAPADALALAERLGQTPQAGSVKPAATEITP